MTVYFKPAIALSLVFKLLMILIALIPALLLAGGGIIQSIFGILVCVALGLTGFAASAADVKTFFRATGWLKFTILVPTLWIVVQLLPLSGSVAHPVWTAATSAFKTIGGHITIDTGVSLFSLVFFLALLALNTITVFVTKVRTRAEAILLTLNIVTTFSVFALLISRSAQPLLHDNGLSFATDTVLTTISISNLILTMANIVRAIERNEERRRSPHQLRLAIATYLPAIAISIVSLIVIWQFNAAVVAAFSVATFLCVHLIRRFGLSNWSIAFIFITALGASVMIIASRYSLPSASSPLLEFAIDPIASSIPVTKRMIADAGASGVGVGTYRALLPIYQEIGGAVAAPPTSAAAYVIELGWPVGVLLALIAIQVIVMLLRGALTRGRDSFYSTGAAACMVAVLTEAFCDASLLHTGVAALTAIIVGLGLAQTLTHPRSHPKAV